jgi:hypothetical protein
MRIYWRDPHVYWQMTSNRGKSWCNYGPLASHEYDRLSNLRVTTQWEFIRPREYCKPCKTTWVESEFAGIKTERENWKDISSFSDSSTFTKNTSSTAIEEHVALREGGPSVIECLAQLASGSTSGDGAARLSRAMAELEHRSPSVAKTLARVNIGTEGTVQEQAQRLLPVVECAVASAAGVLKVLELLEQDEGFAVHEGGQSDESMEIPQPLGDLDEEEKDEMMQAADEAEAALITGQYGEECTGFQTLPRAPEPTQEFAPEPTCATAPHHELNAVTPTAVPPAEHQTDVHGTPTARNAQEDTPLTVGIPTAKKSRRWVVQVPDMGQLSGGKGASDKVPATPSPTPLVSNRDKNNGKARAQDQVGGRRCREFKESAKVLTRFSTRLEEARNMDVAKQQEMELTPYTVASTSSSSGNSGEGAGRKRMEVRTVSEVDVLMAEVDEGVSDEDYDGYQLQEGLRRSRVEAGMPEIEPQQYDEDLNPGGPSAAEMCAKYPRLRSGKSAPQLLPQAPVPLVPQVPRASSTKQQNPASHAGPSMSLYRSMVQYDLQESGSSGLVRAAVDTLEAQQARAGTRASPSSDTTEEQVVKSPPSSAITSAASETTEGIQGSWQVSLEASADSPPLNLEGSVVARLAVLEAQINRQNEENNMLRSANAKLHQAHTAQVELLPEAVVAGPSPPPGNSNSKDQPTHSLPSAGVAQAVGVAVAVDQLTLEDQILELQRLISMRERGVGVMVTGTATGSGAAEELSKDRMPPKRKVTGDAASEAQSNGSDASAGSDQEPAAITTLELAELVSTLNDLSQRFSQGLSDLEEHKEQVRVEAQAQQMLAASAAAGRSVDDRPRTGGGAGEQGTSFGGAARSGGRRDYGNDAAMLAGQGAGGYGNVNEVWQGEHEDKVARFGTHETEMCSVANTFMDGEECKSLFGEANKYLHETSEK